nr:transporter substrate-binding domain-containing protein [uncultured Duganella sp.]
MALSAVPLLSCARPPAVRELVAAGTRNEGIFERSANGEFSGMAVELIRLVAQRHNYQLRFQIYPWRRALEVVAGGKSDLLAAAYKTPERQRVMRYSQHDFFRDEVAFYGRSRGVPGWQGDYARLAGRRIAVINGWSYGPAFARAAPQLLISVTNTVENGLRMLERGHVELFASNRRDTEPVLDALDLREQVTALAPLIDTLSAFFTYPLAPRYPELPAQMDLLLTEMKRNGELQKLALRYGATPP